MSNTKEDQTKDQATPMMSIAGSAQRTPEQLDDTITRQQEKLRHLEKMRELRDAARPLMDYLIRNHNPHFKVIVESHRVELLSEECSLLN